MSTDTSWTTTFDATFDSVGAQTFVADTWAGELLDQLRHYITIPALSPAFDPHWATTGHLAAAVEHVRSWMADRVLAGMTVEVRQLEGRTPVILANIPPFGPAGANADGTVLLYGHLDKQPEMEGWRDGLGPWTPVLEGERLYGRGGADDGYSPYAALTALETLQRHGGSHGRCVVLIEASEESGSPDLPAHVEALAPELGPVSLVVCLDSGCASYDTVWLTTSLRGLVDGVLTVSVLTEGVHSGSASGVVPSTFRIIRQLLERVEEAATGRVLIDHASVEVPQHRRAEARAMAGTTTSPPGERFPFRAGTRPMIDDNVEALLARTWRPALSYIGLDGMPPTGRAGNVLRPTTSLKLSLRLPPTAEPLAVQQALRATLEADPPYGATVSFDHSEAAPGWNAPDLAPWLRAAVDHASQEAFGQPAQLMGEGGTIPFMAMLGERFPAAQFLVTGVLGPESNAHGPNEFLHVGYAERLTMVVVRILQAHATHS
jgi:acetylornithine deacetylase/succinyl-diaminopimelate desuccinylase-like protein